MNSQYTNLLKQFSAWCFATCCVSILLTGCAGRTSPKTVSLASVQSKMAAPVAAIEHKSTAGPVVVGIRYPATFQSTEAKLLLQEKVNQMMIPVDKKGRALSAPFFSWQYFPEETPYKSLDASLQVRDALLSNPNVHVFLLPCTLIETNGDLFLKPLKPDVQTTVTVDISLLNLMTSYSNIPWYKIQGCSISRYLAPMVAVSVASESETNVVAGTRRWLTKDRRLAVVLPEVLDRRARRILNFPIVTRKQSEFPPLNTARPVTTSGYYELDSFVERDKDTEDFRAYWNFVAKIIGEVAGAVSVNSTELAKTYARRLGAQELSESKIPVARKFMQAEWMFAGETDKAMVQALLDSKWFDAIKELGKSEDKLLAKAKSRHFWNQFAQVGMAFAGGAAAGLGAASAAQTGTYYNSTPTTMMTMSAVQAIADAGAQEQLAAVSSYKNVVGTTEASINAVSLGLGDEASGATIKSIDDIRRIARKHLGANTAGLSESKK